jgi:hypothetical protein
MLDLLLKAIPKLASKTPFHLKRVDAERAAQSFFDILDGNAVGVHVKSYLPKAYCEDLEARFHTSPIRRPRADGVPGYEAGVTQYKKNPFLLSKLSYGQHGHIRDLLGNAENPIIEFYRQIALIGSFRNLTIRPATFGAEAMPIVRAIQWAKKNPEDKMLLEMHDDIAQVKAKINAGFEIKDVEKIIAINFYPKSKENSGQLAVVDWQPTDAEREALGVSDVGYPYREENLPKNSKRHLFNQETGDLIIMDGSYVHGVVVGNDECSDRLIVNGFAALLKNNNIVLFA